VAKILLVEDDNNLREIYEARLTAEGYDIISAQNGEEALVLAKQHHPDLVITDVMMPRISGYEMVDILRNTDELKDTKVIMLTALGQAEDKDRAGKLGADKYLVKSQVTLEDIVNSTKAVLSTDESGAPSVTGIAPAAAAAAQSAAQTPLTAVSTDPATADPLQTQPSAQPAQSPVPSSDDQATPTDDDSQSQSSSMPPTAPPIAPISDPSGTPVSVNDVIETQPDAQGNVEATSAQVEQVQSTPLGDTDLLTGEQKAISDDEAALAQQLSGLPPESADSAASQTPSPADASVIPAPAMTGEAIPDQPMSAPVSIETRTDQVVPDPTLGQTSETSPETTTPEVAPSPAVPPEAPTAVPATIDPAAIPQPETEGQPQTSDTPETDQVTVTGKKVIQPPTDTQAKPDLNQLLAAEEAKEAAAAGTTPVAPPDASPVPAPEATPTTDKPKPASGFDPNSVAL